MDELSVDLVFNIKHLWRFPLIWKKNTKVSYASRSKSC